ncbi:MAG: hypothetical protein GY935_10710 [Gammaproteobacteria bacterium]|nr:hypothetical protein [Gammaproteobacteria bacterium]
MVTEKMMTSLEAIALVNDLTAVRAVEYIYEHFGSVPIDAEGGQLEVPPDPTLQALLQSIERDEQILLSDAESICAARWILCQIVKGANGPALVFDALEKWNDETQSVGTQLQWILVGTLMLCVATTEVKIDSNGFSIHKKAALPEQIEATASFLKVKINVKVLD